MSVNTINVTTQMTTTYQHINSGLPTTVTQLPASLGTQIQQTSGTNYQNKQTIASGQTVTYNLASGALKDLVGDVANISKLMGLTIQPSSGAIQIETSQSGGMNLPMVGISGGGLMLNPGAVYQYMEGSSGVFSTVSDVHGNVVARAVSGACYLSFGYYGL